MSASPFEQGMLKEKEELFNRIILISAKVAKVTPPQVNIWDGYCPDSTCDEGAHIHLDTKEGRICISKYRLRSMNFTEVEDTAVHANSPLCESGFPLTRHVWHIDR